MKFLIDEDVSPKLAEFLKESGHSAIHIREIQTSLEDYQILELAVTGKSIVITEDKDFGELVFKNRQSSKEVILLRLENQTVQNTKKAIMWLLSHHLPDNLEDHFVVVTEKTKGFTVRIGSPKTVN